LLSTALLSHLSISSQKAQVANFAFHDTTSHLLFVLWLLALKYFLTALLRKDIIINCILLHLQLVYEIASALGTLFCVCHIERNLTAFHVLVFFCGPKVTVSRVVLVKWSRGVPGPPMEGEDFL
jgi:hypothetical protein